MPSVPGSAPVQEYKIMFSSFNSFKNKIMKGNNYSIFQVNKLNQKFYCLSFFLFLPSLALWNSRVHKNISKNLILLTIQPTLSLFPPTRAVGMRNIARTGPPLFPFPCIGTWDKGQPWHRIFSYHDGFAPSLYSFVWDTPGGFGWLGPSLSSVLTSMLVVMRDMWQPFQMTL
jgi:hypothetical protein